MPCHAMPSLLFHLNLPTPPVPTTPNPLSPSQTAVQPAQPPAKPAKPNNHPSQTDNREQTRTRTIAHSPTSFPAHIHHKKSKTEILTPPHAFISLSPANPTTLTSLRNTHTKHSRAARAPPPRASNPTTYHKSKPHDTHPTLLTPSPHQKIDVDPRNHPPSRTLLLARLLSPNAIPLCTILGRTHLCSRSLRDALPMHTPTSPSASQQDDVVYKEGGVRWQRSSYLIGAMCLLLIGR